MREQGCLPERACTRRMQMPAKPPGSRPQTGRAARCWAQGQPSCCPHGTTGKRRWPPQVRDQIQAQQEKTAWNGPPQRNGPLPGRPGPRPPGERADRPRHRPRAAPPGRRLRTTGHIPRPDGQPRPPAPPHPWGAREPAPASEPRPALPLQQAQKKPRQFPCGPARRMRMDAPYGKQEPALHQRETVPLPAQMPPLPPQTGHLKVPLPVRPPVRQPWTRGLSRCRAQERPSRCPHGGGQTPFSGRWQVPAAPQLVPYRRTGPPEEFPEVRLSWWQRSAMPLPLAGRPPQPGDPCPAQISFSARCPVCGKTPGLPSAVLQGHPPAPFRLASLPAAPFSPLRPPLPAVTETQDRRPPATRGPWSW